MILKLVILVKINNFYLTNIIPKEIIVKNILQT